MVPLMPPAALISSTAILVAFCMIWPDTAEEPDSGQIRPRLKAPSTLEDSEVPAAVEPAVDAVVEAELPQAVAVRHMAAAMIQAIVFFIVSLSFHYREKRGHACMHAPSE